MMPRCWPSLSVLQAYFGNSIVAIVAGVVGGYAADSFGLVAPFDMSMVHVQLSQSTRSPSPSVLAGAADPGQCSDLEQLG